MIHQQGNVVSWATWRGNPYDQDAGSTLNPTWRLTSPQAAYDTSSSKSGGS